MMKTSEQKAIDGAVDFFGSESKLARACGVTRQAIHASRRRARGMSVAMAIKIERASCGKLTIDSLIPNVCSSVNADKIEIEGFPV